MPSLTIGANGEAQYELDNDLLAVQQLNTGSTPLALKIEDRPLDALRPSKHNARTHSKKQLHKIEASLSTRS